MNIFLIEFPPLHLGYLYAYTGAGVLLAASMLSNKVPAIVSKLLAAVIVLFFLKDLYLDWRYPIFSFAEVYFGYALTHRVCDFWSSLRKA